MENESFVRQVVVEDDFDAKNITAAMQLLPRNGVVMGRKAVYE